MCLGIPAKIIEVDRENGVAVVDVFGNKAEVDITLVEDVEPGDYVMVHAGAAIAKVDEEQWKESFEMWKQVLEAVNREYERLYGNQSEA
ncbi:hydrogenase assembly protein HypC [Ignicoccus islandicus DSM 13165]|uniref:Hydrogenase assembly protein HypC n=1 Tax=Ignicoccus islandicus DSM 13165 TaxID=940295 RepID=A0A0U3EA90_9CREN|nr:HypC/HybG/HupF family hydrogenase formation chaperone [Ignicoccus islandicus]ALU11347.1 hydrogenase assembly protein HypC [Ignicoccus islandicus DSM 13165]